MARCLFDQQTAARFAAGQAVAAIALQRTFHKARIAIAGPRADGDMAFFVEDVNGVSWPTALQGWIGILDVEPIDYEYDDDLERESDTGLLIEMAGWIVALDTHQDDGLAHEGFHNILCRIGESFCGGDDWTENASALSVQSKIESLAREKLNTAPDAVVIIAKHVIDHEFASYAFCVEAVRMVRKDDATERLS